MQIYRQGDVAIIPVARLPRVRTPVAREGGRIVLAHGEATGHAHALVDDQAGFFEAPATTKRPARRYLRLVKGARLFHEEHAPIELPPGQYEVRRQREYSPEEIRTVAD